MPTYEYECTACGHRMEVFQRLADDPLTTCERCGGKLRKLFHPVGISFKGSGFYTTDSRKVSKNGEPKKKPAAEPSKGGKDTKKTSKDTPKDTPKPSSTA
jgi:putative FmdB family regulatory protein